LSENENAVNCCKKENDEERETIRLEWIVSAVLHRINLPLITDKASHTEIPPDPLMGRWDFNQSIFFLTEKP